MSNYAYINGKKIELSDETVKNLKESLTELKLPATKSCASGYAHVGIRNEAYPIIINLMNGENRSHDGLVKGRELNVSETKSLIRALQETVDFVEQNNVG